MIYRQDLNDILIKGLISILLGNNILEDLIAGRLAALAAVISSFMSDMSALTALTSVVMLLGLSPY